MFSPEAVKRRCNGMLPSSAYRRIYDAAARSEVPTLVEVGTGHAAATVCMALGLKDSRGSGKVYSFERAEGGSRAKFGGVNENTQIIQANLDHFGVGSLVELVIGDVAVVAHRVPADCEIGMLMLDADGRIDRDILLFYDRMIEGCAVIIDDVANRVRLGRRADGLYVVDQKHRITHLLLEAMVDRGLLSRGEITQEIYFGEKLDGNAQDLLPETVLDAYRQLVFGEASLTRRSLKSLLLSVAEFASPRAVDAYRRRRRRAREVAEAHSAAGTPRQS